MNHGFEVQVCEHASKNVALTSAKLDRIGSDGQRLVELRRARGLTQVQLAEAIESSQRAISYYENKAEYPPAPVVADLARALSVSTDELLGLKAARKVPERESPEERRLWKKFQHVQSLPERDQRAVIRLVNSLAAGGKG